MARSIVARAAILVLSACGEATAPPGTEPAPAYLDLLEGDAQETWVGNPLLLPLTVRVRDAAGAPRAGVPVMWDASDGAGTLNPGMVTTDEAGEARTTRTLGLEEGESLARATVLGLSAVTFTAWGRISEGRAFDDRLDDLAGEQIHVLYVVPRGGTDRTLDAEGVLTRSVERTTSSTTTASARMRAAGPRGRPETPATSPQCT